MQTSQRALDATAIGTVIGLVCIEDLLEEIVGEIRDEYDAAPEPTVREEREGVFVADGRVPLDDLSAALDQMREGKFLDSFMLVCEGEDESGRRTKRVEFLHG